MVGIDGVNGWGGGGPQCSSLCYCVHVYIEDVEWWCNQAWWPPPVKLHVLLCVLVQCVVALVLGGACPGGGWGFLASRLAHPRCVYHYDGYVFLKN